MKGKNFDVIVIGGGTGGLRTALVLAHSHFNTLLLEPGELGGTCLNNGCIPTKVMLEAAHVYRTCKSGSVFGIDANPKINFPNLMKRVNSIINTGQDHIIKSIDTENLTIVKGHAYFTGRNIVNVKGDQYYGKKIIIATGAKNFCPSIKGLENIDYLTNQSLIKLKKLPKSIVIIGGGYISIEFATFFMELGAKVSILEVGKRVLSMLDEDVSSEISKYYTDQGVDIITGARVREIKKTKTGVKVFLNGRNPISAERLMMACGRVPNTLDLDVHAAGVTHDNRGRIKVNNLLQTKNKSIYCIGDANGRAMFAHAAKRESHIVLNQIIHRKKEKMNFHLIPWAVFTHPPIAGVGMSEQDARNKGHKIMVSKVSFSHAGRTTIINDTRGFVKVIYDKMSKRILGVVMIGARSDEMIHEFAAVMNSKSPTIDTIHKTIHAHPTISEVNEALK